MSAGELYISSISFGIKTDYSTESINFTAEFKSADEKTNKKVNGRVLFV